MTIGSAAAVRWRYTGDNSTPEWAYDTKIYAASDLDVYLGGALQASGYSVTGIGADAGGLVVFDTAPATGVDILILLNMPIQQPADYDAGGAFPATSHEDALDRGRIIDKQLLDAINRTSRLAPADLPDTLDPMPTKPLRASKLAGWDSAGQWIPYEPDSSDSELVTAAGSATPRSLAERFGDMINVFDYGAAGDGSTDDSAAIQAAIDAGRQRLAASGAPCVRVLMPHADYRTASGIAIVDGIRLVGEIDKGARLKFTGTGPAIYSAYYDGGYVSNLSASLADVTSGAKDCESIGLCDLQVEGYTGSTVSGALIDLVGALNARIERLTATHITNDVSCLRLRKSWDVVFSRVQLARGGAYSGGAAFDISDTVNDIAIEYCRANGAWLSAVDLGGCNGWTILRGDFSGGSAKSGNVGIRVDGGRGGLILGAYQEGNEIDIRVGETTVVNGLGVFGTYHLAKAGQSINVVRLDKAIKFHWDISNDIDPSAAYSQRFHPGTSSTSNYGNVIELLTDDADGKLPSDFGLDGGGRHLLRLYASDHADHRTFAAFSCANNSPLERSEKQANVRGSVNQGVWIHVENDGGTLKHRISDLGDSAVGAQFDGQINGATTVLTATPSVNSGTDFAAGAGIDAGAAHRLLLDTASQIVGETLATAHIVLNTSGTDVNVRLAVISSDVNGETIPRIVLVFSDKTAGTNWSINTTNLTAGKAIDIHVTGWIH